MQNHSENGEVAVGGAPSWCLDPEHCSHSPGSGKKCGKCKNIPHLSGTGLDRAEGMRFLWVYYPQGILRRPAAESDLYTSHIADARFFLPHECGGTRSTPQMSEAAQYPGQTLFQDSFFFCRFKKLGDTPGLGDVYVEIVVDGYSGLAFAKVYHAKSAMNATDIMTTRVVPFFKRQGVSVELVHTRYTKEYCGIAPLHPYETLLASSRIDHEQKDQFDQAPAALCERFFAFLQREFFGPALRSRYQHTLETLQHELDEFVSAYNSARPSLAPSMRGRPPLRAFPDTAQT